MSQYIARKTTSHPVRLQATSIVTALTTALARPPVDTLGIEFLQEDAISAPVGVTVKGAFRVACHPGIANLVHLHQLVSWALQCAADARGNWKKSKKNDRIMRRRTPKKWNQDWKMTQNWQLHAPRYQDETNLTHTDTVQVQFQLRQVRSAHLQCLFQFGHRFSIGLIRPSHILWLHRETT